MTAYYRNRLLILVAAIAACALFEGVGRWARVPYFPRFEVSLAVMPSPVARTAAVLVTLVAATVLGTLIAGSVRAEAGLFAAAVGLCALSMRGGPMRYVWAHEEIPGLRYKEAVELAICGAAIAGLWTALSMFATRRMVPGEMTATLDAGPEKAKESRAKARALAFAVHLAVTAVAAVLLLASDDKKQAVVGVMAASFLGAVAASLVAPAAPVGQWLWTSPILVGLVGYLSPQPAGAAADPLAALLRAAPLDYAGSGVAGAILGHWMGFAKPGEARDMAIRGLFGSLYDLAKARQQGRPHADGHA
jgi:hypothetical protein